MRFKVTVMYDGSSFFGWQIQPNKRTIQDTIQQALSRIQKEDSNIHASGRTDADVHAYGQVFHFDSKLTLKPEDWKRALNGSLPKDIRILDVEQVEDTFHARFDAKSKTYRYKLNPKSYDVFTQKYIYQYNQDLNIESMNKTAALYIGTHNFLAFNATPIDVIEDQVRTIEHFKVFKDDDIILFEIKGDGFLRHMVRMLVATLVAVEEEKLTHKEIEDALKHPDKDKIKFNIPGCGLYLVSVDY